MMIVDDSVWFREIEKTMNQWWCHCQSEILRIIQKLSFEMFKKEYQVAFVYKKMWGSG